MASRPSRSFTAALGVAFGIATVLSIQVVDHNTILTQEQRREASVGSWEVNLRPVKSGAPVGGATPTALTEEADIEHFAAFFNARLDAWNPAAPDNRTALRIRAVGPGAELGFAPPVIAEGRELRQPGAAEVLLGPEAAEFLGVGIGDDIELQRMALTREGCVDGENIQVESEKDSGRPRPYEVVGILGSSRMQRNHAVVMPFEAGLPLFEGAPLQTTFWGKLRAGAVYQDVRERLKDSFIIEKVKTASVGERIDQRAFRKSLRFTSTLALLLGLFVIYHGFSMALVERVREIGLLRAIGMRRGLILRATLIEGGILAVFGAALGILLTVLVVFGMQAAGITTLGYGKPLEIREVPWLLTGGVVALGMLCALLGMAAPLLRARHLSVIQALRAGSLALRSDPGFSLRLGVFVGVPVLIPLFYVLVTPPLGERQAAVFDVVLRIALVLLAFFLVLLVVPGPLHRIVEWTLRPLRAVLPIETPLSQAAIRGSRHRVMGTLAGLSVVVATLFCVRAVNHSFLDEMDRFSVTAMHDRVFLRSRKDVELDVLRQRLTGIAAVEDVYSLSAEILSPFPLRGVELEDLLEARPELRDDERFVQDFASGRCLLLSQFLADSFGYELHDEVRLPTFQGPETFRVGAISDDFGYYPDDRSFGLVDSSRMDQLWCLEPDRGRRFVATIAPDFDHDDAEGAVTAALDGLPMLWVRSDETLRRQYLTDRRRDFLIFDVILGMVAALAAVGLWNSLTIALLERRRELSLLHAVGMTGRQLTRLLRLEALAVALVAGLLAVAVSIPISSLALDAVRIISRLELAYRPNLWAVFAPILVSLAIALLAVWWPSRRPRKVEAGALARYE